MLGKDLLIIYRLGMFEKNFKKASICFRHTSSTNPLTFLSLLIIYRSCMSKGNFKTEASICSRHSSSANRFTFLSLFRELERSFLLVTLFQQTSRENLLATYGMALLQNTL